LPTPSIGEHMAESSLSLGFPDFQAEVGSFLGHGRDTSAWAALDPDPTDDVEAIIQAGLRQFYFPPSMGGKDEMYEWSFLKPVTTLTTTADDYDQTLPDDFGGLLGDFTYPVGTGFGPVKERNELQIRDLRQALDSTGRPQYFAIRERAGTGTTGQRLEVIWFPTPDAVYTMTYQYLALVNKISAASPYPLGGMAHAETIMESCLAIAEARKDDEKGIHWDSFMTRLKASMRYDQQRKPAILGYNGDRSDERDDGYLPLPEISLNGVVQS